MDRSGFGLTGLLHTTVWCVWGRGLVDSDGIINSVPWHDREAPSCYLAGEYAPPPKNRHALGVYSLYFIDPEQSTGKWHPISEMGTWVGLNLDVRTGYLICPN